MALNGGAIYAEHNSYAWRGAVINQSLFNGNVAENGSAFYYKGFDVLLIDSNFTNNNASGKGTLFLIGDNNPLDGNITSCLFENNFAHDGGAVCIDGNLISYANKFVSNDAVNGGALYVADNGFVNLTNDVFKENSAITGTDNIDSGLGASVIMNNVDPEDLGPTKAAVIDIVNFTESIAYGDIMKITVKVTWQGEPLEGVVCVNSNQNYTSTLENGTATISIPNLGAGSYDVNVTFAGESVYTKTNKSVHFTVAKLNAAIDANNGDCIINYGKAYSITLKDAEGKALAGKNVNFILNGKSIASAETNAQGVATITLTAKILKEAKAGKKNLVIEFADSNYNSVSQTVKITINKEKTKLVAKNKKFKKSKKVKKYMVTLKNSKGKVIKNVKVTLKVKGKKYTVKTNAKGKATFKIKNLKKKGKFNAAITFKGNAYYYKVAKKVKITVK